MINKKAQGTEMLGLLVIIILLIVLVGLYFSFSSGTEDTAITGSLRYTQLNDMIDTMFRYTPCKDVTLKDVLNTYITGGGNICGQNSETLLKQEIKNILQTYFGREFEREDMEFRVYEGTGNLDELNELTELKLPEQDISCESGKISTRTTIHMYPKSATVTLAICR